MNAIDLAKAGLTSSLGTTLAFLEGFSDTDMLVRPADMDTHQDISSFYPFLSKGVSA